MQRPKILNTETGVLYECTIKALTLQLQERQLDMTSILENGRANYILFETLTGELTGLHQNSQGGSADLRDSSGRFYEVKSYRDHVAYPQDRFDLFHTAASSTFGPNNKGPVIKKLLEIGDYASALKICKEAGYNHSDFFIYTNTSKFSPVVPFRYLVVRKEDVLKLLADHDPRQISRRGILATCNRTVKLC